MSVEGEIRERRPEDPETPAGLEAIKTKPAWKTQLDAPK